MNIDCQALIESLSDAVLWLSNEGRIQYANPAALNLFRATEDQLLRNSPEFLFSPHGDPSGSGAEWQLIRARRQTVTEGWRYRADGSRFWGECSFSPVPAAGESVKGFICLLRDVSQRKEAEFALREREERYRLMIEGVLDYAIFMLDDRGHIMTWNEGARRTKGYEPAEIIGKHFSTFYTQEDLDSRKPERELKIASETGKYEEEGWRLRKDGSRFWANVLITAVRNGAGTLIGFSKVTRDLTERRRSEQALRESYEQYRLLAERLRDTNSRLSFANEELEQFTSIVSHDLQEPIRTIKSFLQLIEMKLPPGEETLHGYIRKSINASTRMRELIQNLLHYSQLSRGELMESQVPVSDLFNRALQNLRSSIESSHAEITVESEVELVQGDPIQLVQVVQNLLSNALKFTQNDLPRIHVHCRREADGTVKFSVTDNGIGIEQSDMPKVFEIFRRLHTRKEYPGTGIGLAICKKIVDRHRGRIWPESEPGKGTTFFFTIHDGQSDIQTA